MSQTERGNRPKLAALGQEPRVQVGGFWFALEDLRGVFKGERGQKAYQGPLRDFFEAGPLPLARVKIILGKERRFNSLVSFFESEEPGREFLRITFIEPTTREEVVLDLSPQRLEIRKVEEEGEQPPREVTVFSRSIYSERSPWGIKDRFLVSQPANLSIRDAERISDLTAIFALAELDSIRRAPGLKEQVRLEPQFFAAQVIVEIIGQNLGALPQEQRG